MAEEVSGEALALLVVNRLRGVMQVCAVKAPGFGDRRKEMLEDLAIVTGGRPVLADIGVELESVQIRDLGRATCSISGIISFAVSIFFSWIRTYASSRAHSIFAGRLMK